MHPVSLSHDIPDDASHQLAMMAPAGVQCVAFTPAGGWVIAGRPGGAHAGYAARGIPDACFVQLGAFVRAGHAIRAIVFPPSRAVAWAIVTDRADAASGIADDAFAALAEARALGARPACLAFTPTGDGWVLLTEGEMAGGHRLRGRGVDARCWQALANLAQGQRPARRVAFAPGGGWLVAAPDRFVAEGIDQACRDHLAQVAQRHAVDRVAFAPNGGWAVGSAMPKAVWPADPLREVEDRFRLVNGRWRSLPERMAALGVAGARVTLRWQGQPAWTIEQGVPPAAGSGCRVDGEAVARRVVFAIHTEGGDAAALADEIAEAVLRADAHVAGAAAEPLTR